MVLGTYVHIIQLVGLSDLFSTHSKAYTVVAKCLAYKKGVQRNHMPLKKFVVLPSAVESKVPSGFRSVAAPVSKPKSSEASHSGSNVCDPCGESISGLYVKAAGKNLHPDCFKCDGCDVKLANKGYFALDGKLFCEEDARKAKAAHVVGREQAYAQLKQSLQRKSNFEHVIIT